MLSNPTRRAAARHRFASLSALCLLAPSLLIPTTVDPVGAATTTDACAVRSQRTITTSSQPVQLGVDADGRIYEMTVVSTDGGPSVPFIYGVVRFTPAGARDTTYGPVRIEAFGSRPLMVVERDGSVTIATYTSESHSELRYHRIDADGRLSTIRTIGRPGHYVTGVGRFDAGEQLLSGVVVVPPGGGAATVLVLDVDTGKILRETSVTHVGDVTAVSRRAFALEDGSVSIDGAPPVQLPIPSTHDRPRITDLLDVDGGVVAVGSADVVATSPLFARSRSLFARFATSPSTPEVLTIGTTVRSFIAVDPGGLAVLDEPEANGWVVGEPRPKRDIDVVRLDFDTGGQTVIAAIDDERAAEGFPSSAVVVRPDGSARVISQILDNTRRVIDVWGDTPTPPRPAALTGQVERLYRAYFGRAPEPPGLLYWRTQRARGLSIDNVSDAFASSPEFTATYGSVDDGQFVDLVYRNVLGRSADAAGGSFWVGQLSNGTSRGAVMTGFSDSAEFVAATATAPTHLASEGQVARLYRAYFERDPDPTGFCYWAGQIETLGVDAVSTEFARSDEFTATYGALTDTQFVDLVYENVLGRLPDGAGTAYWLGQLGAGVERGRVMTAFSESAEYLLQTDSLPATP